MRSSHPLLRALLVACSVVLPVGLPTLVAAQERAMTTGVVKIGGGEFEGSLTCRGAEPAKAVLVARASMSDDSKQPNTILKVEVKSGAASFAVYTGDGKKETAVRGWNTAALEKELKAAEAMEDAKKAEGRKRGYANIMGQFNLVMRDLGAACANNSAESLKAATGRSIAVYASVKGLEPWASQLGREYRAGNR